MNNNRDNIFCEYSDEESAFVKGALSSNGDTDGIVQFRMTLRAKEYTLCDFSMFGDMPDDDFDLTEQYMQNRDPDRMTGEEAIAKAFAEVEHTPESEEYSVNTEAYFAECPDGRCVITYGESLDGESEQISEIHFDRDAPELVTICRSGLATVVMTVEEGRRHGCVYRTPYMDFDMRIHALRVENTVTAKGGKLRLDYALEIRGAAAHRTVMEIELVRE